MSDLADSIQSVAFTAVEKLLRTSAVGGAVAVTLTELRVTVDLRLRVVSIETVLNDKEYGQYDPRLREASRWIGLHSVPPRLQTATTPSPPPAVW